MGICSRNTMDEENIDYYYNDEYRYDGQFNSISLSVASPNYKMFYKLRMENNNRHWVVLELDANEILKMDCAFCYTNAANSCVSSIPIDKRMTLDAFEDMFYETSDEYRRRVQLSEFEPTDPQAEILVFETIPSKCIEYVHFQCFEDYLEYLPLLKEYNIEGAYTSSFFYPRRDYKYW